MLHHVILAVDVILAVGVMFGVVDVMFGVVDVAWCNANMCLVLLAQLIGRVRVLRKVRVYSIG